ncbi:wnt inhibitor of Dorsal protein [Teleopsis dalmanni]|uniref:wnt inhibitor of Dorsal protein n=1 Tax=Teleopsis dalmanni TaxID=139649 RepID=UPI0018CEFBB6|nr:wnt inhibitor of Dorsal protein [Teleopsis dalmanni]
MVETATLMKHLNYFNNQNPYSTEIFQASFSLENVMGNSIELALQSCQQSFKWSRWNCPSTDFFMRRTSKPLQLDREDAYVTAIAMSAILYTITKDCASGLINDCRVSKENSIVTQCAEDPKKALQIYEQHIGAITFNSDFHGSVLKHNHKVITNLLSKSLVQQCGCASMGVTGCTNEICINVLKPFAEIAADIYQMYENAIELNNNFINSRVIWENVPLDSLVFMKESPNYCEPDAVLNWNGVRGRQCSTANEEYVSTQERESCQTLCHGCGFKVVAQNQVTERRCNCKLTWGFQVQCDTCVNVERQYYCY